MTQNQDRLLRDHEAAALLGCSKSTFWRRVSDGTFPQAIKIGGLTRWSHLEIWAVVEAAKARRETE
ncbi:MAG: AlpA family phage regulatory protein [Pirellulales bacterium]